MPEQQMVEVPVTLLQRFVSFTEKAGALLEQVERESALAKQAAPVAVEAMLKHGLIGESAKVAAIEALGTSHSKTIETLRRAADQVGPATMGSPAGETKAASAGSTAMAEADRRFNAALGFGG